MLEILGDMPMNSIDRGKITLVLEKVSKLPANRHHPAFKGKSVDELLAMPNMMTAPNIRRALRRVNVDRVVKGIKFSKPSNGVYWCSNYLTKALEQTRQYLNESPVHADNQTRREIENFWTQNAGSKSKPTTSKPVDFDALRQGAARARSRIRELIVTDEESISVSPDLPKPKYHSNPIIERINHAREQRRLHDEEARREWDRHRPLFAGLWLSHQ